MNINLRGLIARAGCLSPVRDCYRNVERIPVLGRITRRWMQKALPLDVRVWAPVLRGPGKGLLVWVNPRYGKPYLEGYHEIGIQQLLSRYLQEGSVFYDVGAHIGFMSMIAARIVGPKGGVAAFEADPDNVELLRAHIAKNELPQVNICPVAVWSKDGAVRFQRANQATGRMVGAVAQSPAVATREIEVPATTLDCWMTKHRAPSLIKIDVEGGEAEVLAGAEQVFRAKRPTLICEVHNSTAEADVTSWLTGHDYRIQYLTSEPVFPRHFVAEPLRSR